MFKGAKQHTNCLRSLYWFHKNYADKDEITNMSRASDKEKI